MANTELMKLLTAYEAATTDFLAAAQKLQPTDLDKGPAGEWSPRMVVHHLAHADAYCLTRIIQRSEERRVGKECRL